MKSSIYLNSKTLKDTRIAPGTARQIILILITDPITNIIVLLYYSDAKPSPIKKWVWWFFHKYEIKVKATFLKEMCQEDRKSVV